MIVLDDAQQRAVFKLIDGTALVKLLRESALTPRDVRSLMSKAPHFRITARTSTVHEVKAADLGKTVRRLLELGYSVSVRSLTPRSADRADRSRSAPESKPSRPQTPASFRRRA